MAAELGKGITYVPATILIFVIMVIFVVVSSMLAGTSGIKSDVVSSDMFLSSLEGGDFLFKGVDVKSGAVVDIDIGSGVEDKKEQIVPFFNIILGYLKDSQTEAGLGRLDGQLEKLVNKDNNYVLLRVSWKTGQSGGEWEELYFEAFTWDRIKNKVMNVKHMQSGAVEDRPPTADSWMRWRSKKGSLVNSHVFNSKTHIGVSELVEFPFKVEYFSGRVEWWKS